MITLENYVKLALSQLMKAGAVGDVQITIFVEPRGSDIIVADPVTPLSSKITLNLKL